MEDSMSAKLTLVAAAGLSMIVAAGCQKDQHDHSQQQHSDAVVAPKNAKTAVATLTASKIATTQPAVKNVAGTATLTETGNGVRIVADVTGLEPGKKHGIH